MITPSIPRASRITYPSPTSPQFRLPRIPPPLPADSSTTCARSAAPSAPCPTSMQWHSSRRPTPPLSKARCSLSARIQGTLPKSRVIPASTCGASSFCLLSLENFCFLYSSACKVCTIHMLSPWPGRCPRLHRLVVVLAFRDGTVGPLVRRRRRGRPSLHNAFSIKTFEIENVPGSFLNYATVFSPSTLR